VVDASKCNHRIAYPGAEMEGDVCQAGLTVDMHHFVCQHNRHAIMVAQHSPRAGKIRYVNLVHARHLARSYPILLLLALSSQLAYPLGPFILCCRWLNPIWL